MIRSAITGLMVNGLRMWFNHRYGGYGKMITLHVDSERQKIDSEALLKGEVAPIKLSAEYRLLPGAPGVIRLSGITTSREWLNLALEAMGKNEIDVELSATGVKVLGLVIAN